MQPKPDLLKFELFRLLKARGFVGNYTMYQVLQLGIFNPCTWDIFHTYDGKDKMTHLRVKDVSFRMSEGFYQVKNFFSCNRLHHGAWVSTDYTPENLRRYLFNGIIASKAIHGADDKLQCLILPKQTRFSSDWVGAVFYPQDIDVDEPSTIRVVGWSDKLNPIMSESVMNNVAVTESGSGKINVDIVPKHKM